MKINCKLFPCPERVWEGHSVAHSVIDITWPGPPSSPSLYSLQSLSPEVIIRTGNGQIIEKLKLEIVLEDMICSAGTGAVSDNNSSDYYKCVSKSGQRDL